MISHTYPLKNMIFYQKNKFPSSSNYCHTFKLFYFAWIIASIILYLNILFQWIFYCWNLAHKAESLPVILRMPCSRFIYSLIYYCTQIVKHRDDKQGQRDCINSCAKVTCIQSTPNAWNAESTLAEFGLTK